MMTAVQTWSPAAIEKTVNSLLTEEDILYRCLFPLAPPVGPAGVSVPVPRRLHRRNDSAQPRCRDPQLVDLHQ